MTRPPIVGSTLIRGGQLLQIVFIDHRKRTVQLAPVGLVDRRGPEIPWSALA